MPKPLLSRVLVLALLALHSTTLKHSADELLGPAPVDALSGNGRYRARSTPAEPPEPARLTVFTGTRSGGSPASATPCWQVNLANPFGPQSLLVADDGEHVVTLDGFFEVGRGDNVIAFYARTGLLRRYSLEAAVAAPGFAPSESELLSLFDHTKHDRLWRAQSIQLFGGAGAGAQLGLWLDWAKRWYVWRLADGNKAALTPAAQAEWQQAGLEWARAKLAASSTASRGPGSNHLEQITASRYLAWSKDPADRALLERALGKLPSDDGEAAQSSSSLRWNLERAIAVQQGNASGFRSTASEISASQLTKVVVRSKHDGWSQQQETLTLERTGSEFVGPAHRVPEAVIASLAAALWEPLRASVDPADLGLTPAWLAANEGELLATFKGHTNGVPFPAASAAQREWLRKSLRDPILLGEVIVAANQGIWTDDYPEIEIGFYQGEKEVARLHSRSQHQFMLPWDVTWAGNRAVNYSAAISRGVVALLPEGFLHRKRIEGHLLAVIAQGFFDHPKVQDQLQKMILEATLAGQTNKWPEGFELRRDRVGSGWMGGFPDRWRATLHRTNWPAGLIMPVEAPIEKGMVPALPRWLEAADARVQPIVRSAWLAAALQDPAKATIEVAPEGSMADDAYLRDRLVKAGLGKFYAELQPLMKEGLAFTLREGYARTSQWLITRDGDAALVCFTGTGVLTWTPAELGWHGQPSALTSNSYEPVGVRFTPDGRIESVAPRAQK